MNTKRRGHELKGFSSCPYCYVHEDGVLPQSGRDVPGEAPVAERGAEQAILVILVPTECRSKVRALRWRLCCGVADRCLLVDHFYPPYASASNVALAYNSADIGSVKWLRIVQLLELFLVCSKCPVMDGFTRTINKFQNKSEIVDTCDYLPGNFV